MSSGTVVGNLSEHIDYHVQDGSNSLALRALTADERQVLDQAARSVLAQMVAGAVAADAEAMTWGLQPGGPPAVPRLLDMMLLTSEQKFMDPGREPLPHASADCRYWHMTLPPLLVCPTLLRLRCLAGGQGCSPARSPTLRVGGRMCFGVRPSQNRPRTNQSATKSFRQPPAAASPACCGAPGSRCYSSRGCGAAPAWRRPASQHRPCQHEQRASLSLPLQV